MKFLSALRRGVSGSDRPSEICLAVPFFHYGSGGQKMQIRTPLFERSLEK